MSEKPPSFAEFVARREQQEEKVKKEINKLAIRRRKTAEQKGRLSRRKR